MAASSHRLIFINPRSHVFRSLRCSLWTGRALSFSIWRPTPRSLICSTRYSMRTHKVLRAHPIEDTPCSLTQDISMLTHMVLRAHPIRGTPCTPHPRYCVLTPSQVLRAHPTPSTPCTPHPRYSVLTPSQLLLLTPSQVLRAHVISSTPCSAHPWYFVLTPSQVLRAHAIPSTPVSPHPQHAVPQVRLPTYAGVAAVVSAVSVSKKKSEQRACLALVGTPC